ncbi:hypothetical protein [Streptomyces olivaceiscleroticus]|uniref:Secreted protein n=1 Tax=Streptomyces olivaceiscleroticus TaxID=68245 RepID=A0ABN1ADQ9_9ACTN
MTAAHAAAALLVVVLLHRADLACWSLDRGLTAVVDAVRARIAAVRAVLRTSPAPEQAALPALVGARPERAPPKTAVLSDVVVRRGPPQAGLTLAH